MSDKWLDFIFKLAQFIAEVRKEGGQEYPGKTLYEMISIQTFLCVKCKRNVTLVDKTGCTLRSLNSTLNFQIKKAGQGIGIVVNRVNFIRKKQENYLWENRFLRRWGAALPYFGQFALRAGQEHRNSRFINEFLQDTEDIITTNGG